MYTRYSFLFLVCSSAGAMEDSPIACSSGVRLLDMPVALASLAPLLAQWQKDPLNISSWGTFQEQFMVHFGQAADKEQCLSAVLTMVDSYKENLFRWAMMRQILFEFVRGYEHSLLHEKFNVTKQEIANHTDIVAAVSCHADPLEAQKTLRVLAEAIMASGADATTKKQFVAKTYRLLMEQSKKSASFQKALVDLFKQHNFLPYHVDAPDTRDNNILVLLQEVICLMTFINKSELMDNDTLERVGTAIARIADNYSHDRRLLFITYFIHTCCKHKKASHCEKFNEKNYDIIKDIIFDYSLKRIDTYQAQENDDLLALCITTWNLNEYCNHDKKIILAIKNSGRFDLVKWLLPDVDDRYGQLVSDPEFGHEKKNSKVERLSVCLENMGYDAEKQIGYY